MLELRNGGFGAFMHLKSSYHPAHITPVNPLGCDWVNLHQFLVKPLPANFSCLLLQTMPEFRVGWDLWYLPPFQH